MRKFPPWYLVLAAVLVCASVATPMGYLMKRALDLPWNDIKYILWDGDILLLTRNTLMLCIGTLFVSTLLAAPAAWLTSRTDLWASRLWAVFMVTPLTVPNYLMAYALMGLGGANGMLFHVFGIKIPAINGYWGSLMALSFYFMPFMYFNLRASMLRLDISQSESAMSLGAGPVRRVWRVIVPQLIPGFAAGAVLVLLSVVGDFGVVSLMRYETFSYMIYNTYDAAGVDGRAAAAWYAFIVVGIALLVLLLDMILLHRLHLTKGGALMWRQRQRLNLGWGQAPAMLFLFSIILIGVVTPVGTMVYQASTINWTHWFGFELQQNEIPEVIAADESKAEPVHAPVDDLWGDLTEPIPLGEEREAITEDPGAGWQDLKDSTVESLIAALPSALFAVLLAFPIAFLAQRYTGWVSKLATRAALIGYAIPCLAFGLAIVVFVIHGLDPTWERFTGEHTYVGMALRGLFSILVFLEPAYQWFAGPEAVIEFPDQLYQTWIILIFALSFHYLAEAIGPLRAGLYHASPRLEEASLSLGAGKWRTFWRVTFPLMRGGVMVAMGLVFISAMKELPLTWLLKPNDTNPLSNVVWSYADEAGFDRSAPVALTIVLLSAVFLAILLYHRRKEDV